MLLITIITLLLRLKFKLLYSDSVSINLDRIMITSTATKAKSVLISNIIYNASLFFVRVSLSDHSASGHSFRLYCLSEFRKLLAVHITYYYILGKDSFLLFSFPICVCVCVCKLT